MEWVVSSVIRCTPQIYMLLLLFDVTKPIYM